MDETILSLHPPLRPCWMKCGQQKCIPTPGNQQRLHLFGAYRWEDDTITCRAAQRKNSQAFIEFLEYLFVERYPTGHFILVLDNASIHKPAASLAALSLFEHRITGSGCPLIAPNQTRLSASGVTSKNRFASIRSI